MAQTVTNSNSTTSTPAKTPVPASEKVAKKQLSLDEMLASFQGVSEDIEQISKLASEEKVLVEEFFASMLKLMKPLRPSMEVSTSVLTAEVADATKAQIDPKGRLNLMFPDGHQALLDLTDVNNRDLMVAVISDFIPKFKNLTDQLAAELQKPKPAPVKEIPAPPPTPAPEPPLPIVPESPPPVSVEAPVGLADVAPVEVPAEVPAISEKAAKLVAIETETLEFLGMLGTEVFEQAPVSKYFDDWMVNLRQIILSFESNELIGPEETFSNEYNQIFSNIEAELAKRLAAEADIEVSARRLVENRYLLNKIDEGYAAQTKELVAKGKDAIDQLTRNVAQLEKEINEVAAIKISFRHPLQKMAKDQKLSELTQKLNAAKKQLALAVGSSSIDKNKTGDLASQYEAQIQELSDKRKLAMDLLTTEVKALEGEIAQIDKTKTANPLKRTALAQKRFDTTQKLIAAKKRLEIAEQNSNAELERLKAEYERKKQAALGNVQNLEKDIATKAPDNSAEVRKQAAQALANAVKARIQRKTAQLQQSSVTPQPQTSGQQP